MCVINQGFIILLTGVHHKLFDGFLNDFTLTHGLVWCEHISLILWNDSNGSFLVFESKFGAVTIQDEVK